MLSGILFRVIELLTSCQRKNAGNNSAYAFYTNTFYLRKLKNHIA